MGMTTVGRRRQSKGVYIGRPSIFGNPFVIGKDGDRAAVIEKFRVYFYDRMEADADFRRQVQALKGERLLCYCAPEPCHGDVIADYLNGAPTD